LGLTINDDSNYFTPIDSLNNNAAQIIDWLITNKNALESKGFSVKTPVIDNKPIALLKPNLTITTHQENDWFDIKGTIIIGDFTIPFGQLIPNIRDNNPYFLLPNDHYFIIPNEWFEHYTGLAQFGKIKDNYLRINKSQAPALLPKSLLSEEQTIDNQELTWIPPQYLKAELRPYQIEGVQFLLKHYRNNLGALLADDMGLGKTLQTIATLLFAKENKKKGDQIATGFQMDIFNAAPQEDFLNPLQAIIVLPASLVYNWESEWKKFAPTIITYRLIGPKRHKDIRLIKRFDVVLTTYQTVVKDIDLLEKIEWEYAVLDESQYIKNKESDTFKAVNRLNARHKISLSGTPIENSLSDLWAQMQFINPGHLKSFAFFEKEFIKPIEKGQNDTQKDNLRKLVMPYLLRRTKQEVAKDLPELIEQTIYSEMGDAQRKVYEKEKSAIRNLLLGVELSGKSTFEYQNIVVQSLTKLRQLAIHPQLVIENYTGESAKFDDVLAKWDDVQKANHKLLLFSSFVKNLTLYRHHFDQNHTPYAWLTGDTPLAERQQNILDFEQKADIKTFLMSLKAGGVGLNLTAADYVFILDPWWNPASENQAIARSHRIGQTQKVMAFKFITKDTIEEKIVQLQDRKKQLVADIIDAASEQRFLVDNLAFLLG
jgi:SNF2 family DNA or RNA helicase